MSVGDGGRPEGRVASTVLGMESGSGLHALPPDLPAPEDDGAADHLPGATIPSLRLAATTGGELDLHVLAADLLVLFIYVRTGKPGEPLPAGWDDIPGARGCTAQTCAFRDRHAEIEALGARVVGLSAQPAAEQDELARREGIPYPLLSDPGFRLAGALRLLTFEAAGMRLYRRLTLIARAGRIEHVIYPVFPPGSDAERAATWLREHSSGRS